MALYVGSVSSWMDRRGCGSLLSGGSCLVLRQLMQFIFFSLENFVFFLRQILTGTAELNAP